MNATAVYVAREAVDLRKSIDGLALWVETSLPVSPLSGSVFVFFNRGRDKVKSLWWDRHGFWVAYKRLERGRFCGAVPEQLSITELSLLLEGVDLSVKRFRDVRACRTSCSKAPRKGLKLQRNKCVMGSVLVSKRPVERVLPM